jgi:hypothetical protein
VKTICSWCGRSHKKPPAKCALLSKRASYLVRRGVPAWVLFGMIHQFGTSCLDPDKFNTCAELFIARTGRRRK